MQIRKMEEKDVLQVSQLEKEIFSKPWSKEDFLSSLHKEENVYLVAELEDEIVAYCGMWGIVGEGNINNIAVAPNHRKKGIAHAMMKLFIEEGLKKNLTSFTLEVRKSNHTAIALYKKLGFQEVGIRKDFYELPKEDAVIMWLFK